MDDRSPEEFLTDLQERADEMTRQSQQLQDQLGSLAETASDGGVSVTVGANGALQDLHRPACHAARAERAAHDRPALAGEAQANVAHQVVQAVEPFTSSTGMEFLRNQLPAEPQAPAQDPADDPGTDEEPPQSFLR